VYSTLHGSHSGLYDRGTRLRVRVGVRKKRLKHPPKEGSIISSQQAVTTAA
jgi:hypothetical protein